LKEGSIYTTKKFDWYDPRKSYRSVDHSLRICFTMRTTLSEVVPPPENFPMYAYTAVPFSMLSDYIDWNILISGKNTVILITDLFLYCLFSWKSVFHVMAI
jgi:hypothetical protein